MGETRVCRRFARPLAFFPVPEISKAAGVLGMFISGLCVYRCARRDFPRGNLSLSPLLNRESAVENLCGSRSKTWSVAFVVGAA